MPRAPYQFAGGQRENPVYGVNRQLCVNLYPVIQSQDAGSPVSLYKRPGLRKLTDTGVTGSARHQGIYFQGEYHTVIGSRLVKRASGGAVTVLGSAMQTNSGRVSIACTRTDLVIADGSKLYTWDGTTWAELAAATTGSTSPTHVCVMNFRFIITDANTDTVYASALNDPSTWSAVDYTVAEALPDRIVAVHASMRELWLIGEESIEFYADTGTGTFPFEPVPGGTVMLGCAAAHSVASRGNEVFLLARDPGGTLSVQRAVGYQPASISEGDMDALLASFTTVDDAFGYTLALPGTGTLYVLVFPTENRSFVYASRAQAWMEWKSEGVGRFKCAGVTYAYGKLIAGDALGPNLYELATGAYVDDTDTKILCKRVGAQVRDPRGYRIRHHSLELELDTGGGYAGGVCTLRYSGDHGKTWSYSYERDVPLSRDVLSLHWNRLGMARARIYEFTYALPTRLVILNAWLDSDVVERA